MTAPRQILPGKTYMVTRRCSDRRYFLKPRPAVAALCRFCIAHAAEQYGIELHAVTALSNHWHACLTDTEGRLPEFMRWVNEFLAKTINALYGRWENLWAVGSYSAVLLESPEDVLDKMVYCITNPVTAGLVKNSAEWPGMSTSPHKIGAEGETVRRPDGFFRPEGPVPEAATLAYTVPPQFAHLPVEEFRGLLIGAIKAREADVRREFAASNRTFMGVKGVLKQPPFGSPKTRALRRRLNPRLAGKDKETRLGLIAKLKAFYKAYREAWRAFCDGVRDVVFPVGTYLMKKQYNCVCENSP